MKQMNRRNFFKVITATVGTSLVANQTTPTDNKTTQTKIKLIEKNSKQTRAVVVGGGIGGLSVAQSIKANDSKNSIEVIILERNARYFACPLSNSLFAELKEVKEAGIDFIYDYTEVEKNHNIDVVITEVIGADVKNRTITTTSGSIDYDYVVVAPGIDYDYKKLFPTWSSDKIRRATKETPAAMFSDSGMEKKNLINQLHNWKKSGGEGYFIIVPPKGGKTRCKPASYERACMVSEFIKKHKLKGKVYILDNSPKPQAKGPIFIETFIKYHKDTIIFNGMNGDEMLSRITKAGFNLKNFKKKKNFSVVEDSFATASITDVDFDSKTIMFDYAENFDDDEGKKSTIKYEIANIIPYHRGNKTAEFFDVKRDNWGGIICKANKIYSQTDSRVYAAGDIIGFHKFDPSAQASSSIGLLTGKSIADRILKNEDNIDFTEAGITCFSMINADPLIAIEISKTTIVTAEGMGKAGKSNLSVIDGMGLIGWYQAIVETPFKY